ncbi:MAG: hypothetical protein JW940_30100 [Polyangiaceae bacterium]|nr:hypothetical protein [Polyangiaceae bacterium]
MSGWNKVKGLFWQSAEDRQADGTAALADGDALSDEEFAAMLATSEHAVPAEAADAVPLGSFETRSTAAGAVEIDFQQQYDLAGIPDTDEVEQLESFLGRLDGALPKASKIAAAEAFLGAIGKDRQAVMADAERKIRRVHGLLKAVEIETRQAIEQEQAQIDALQAQIEQHRQSMENVNRHLEGVRVACLAEESRLQATRVFFGNVNPPQKA